MNNRRMKNQWIGKANMLLLLIVCSLGMKQIGIAQQVSISASDAAVTANKILGGYQTDKLIRLKVLSLLTKTSQPLSVVDSMMGTYDIYGKHLLASIDETTYMQNSRWKITVNNATKNIYVDTLRGDSLEVKLATNPLQMLDSLLSVTAGSFYKDSITNDTLILGGVFPNGSEVESFKIWYAANSFNVFRAEYKMPIPQEFSSDTASHSINVQDRYLLKMTYSHVYEDDPTPTLFDERNFFYYDGLRFTPADRFSEYTVIKLF